MTVNSQGYQGTEDDPHRTKIPKLSAQKKARNIKLKLSQQFQHKVEIVEIVVETYEKVFTRKFIHEDQAQEYLLLSGI